MAILTFQYLRELQKKERDSPALQQIDPNFYKALSESLHQSADSEALIALAKSILDTRERKIVSLAIKSARAGIKPHNILPEEDPLFLEVSGAVSNYRDRMDRMLAKNNPASDSAREEALPKNPATSAIAAAIKVRAASDIPAFVGEDMKTYGPLKAGEIAELPEKAAKILVNSKSADLLS